MHDCCESRVCHLAHSLHKVELDLPIVQLVQPCLPLPHTLAIVPVAMVIVLPGCVESVVVPFGAASTASRHQTSCEESLLERGESGVVRAELCVDSCRASGVSARQDTVHEV